MRKNLIVGVILLAAVAGAALYLFPGQETRIRRSLNRLAAAASTSEALHPIMLATRSRSIGGAFATECVFDTPVRSLSSRLSRQDLTQLAARYLAEVTATAMEFQDVRVTLSGPETAEVETRVKAAGLLKHDVPFLEDHAVILRMRQVEGEWLITECEVVKTYSQS